MVNFIPSLLAIILVIVGSVILLLATLWFYVAAFRVSFWWGLACFLFFPAAIPFTVMYWKEVRMPTLASLLGLLLMISGLGVTIYQSGITLEDLLRDIETIRQETRELYPNLGM